MNSVYNLEIIYDILNENKFNLFCKKEFCKHEHDKEQCCDIKNYECECHKDEYCKEKYCVEEKLLKHIACEFLEDNFCKKNIYECHQEECIDLVQLLLIILCEIEECTNCKKNYGYLLQIDKLKCILKNFENLLCQLKCLSTKDCDLLSKALCTLYKIIEKLENIISKINNIECICKSHLCCKHELIECMVCDLEDEINCLEKTVAELSYIVFDIASQDIINCTTCVTSECCKCKKINYSNKYCGKN